MILCMQSCAPHYVKALLTFPFEVHGRCGRQQKRDETKANSLHAAWQSTILSFFFTRPEMALGSE